MVNFSAAVKLPPLRSEPWYASDLIPEYPRLVKQAIFHGLCFYASESPSDGNFQQVLIRNVQ